MSCPIHLSQTEADELRRHEAVLVREWERKAGGDRFGQVVAWGTAAEMQEQTSYFELVVIPNGVHLIGQRTLKTSELFERGSQ